MSRPGSPALRETCVGKTRSLGGWRWRWRRRRPTSQPSIGGMTSMEVISMDGWPSTPEPLNTPVTST